MTKLKLSLAAFAIAFFGSCDLVPTAALAFSHSRPAPIVLPSPTPEASPSPEPSPEPGFTLITTPTISVGTISGASDSEKAMIAKGVDLVNKTMARDCFKQWILAANYTENNGLSQAQIWDKISHEPIQVDVEMYTGTWWANHKSQTVGYENVPYDGVVHMNRYFVSTPQMVADNLSHEGEGHSQGFSHYQAHSTSEPYGMNYAFEGCTAPQQMQRKGGKAYRPPGLRLEIRDRTKHPRIFPKSHQHRGPGRCLEHGKWIKGCQ